MIPILAALANPARGNIHSADLTKRSAKLVSLFIR